MKHLFMLVIKNYLNNGMERIKWTVKSPDSNPIFNI